MDTCRVVSPDQLPADRNHASVARVLADFEGVISRIGAQTTREHDPNEGAAYRYLVLELSSRRYALLLQYENHPSYFSIHLQPIRDIVYRRIWLP